MIATALFVRNNFTIYSGCPLAQSTLGKFLLDVVVTLMAHDGQLDCLVTEYFFGLVFTPPD